MKKIKKLIWIIVAAFLIKAETVCRAGDSYRLIKEIQFSQPIKAISIDDTTHRLYVSFASKIAAMDIGKEQIVGEVTNVGNVRAFAIAPKFKLAYAADSEESKLRSIDLRTLKAGKMGVKTGKNPVSLVLEPSRMELYSLNIGDNTVSRFEADDGDFMENIAMPGKPIAGIGNPKSAYSAYAIEDKNEIAVISTKSHKVEKHWPTAPGEQPSALAIDVEHQRVFVGCANNLLLIMDGVLGHVITTVPVDRRIVACEFNPGTQTITALNDRGTLYFIHEDLPEKFTLVQTIESGQNISASALDLTSHKVYVARNDEKGSAMLVYGTENQAP
jgi:DNA-binding beta-propeller fold protein YncE